MKVQLIVLLVLSLIAIMVWWFFSRPNIEKFEIGSNIVESEECKSYNIRQEVINIFELFLDRKPSVEEIKKYSAIGNEQDIFVEIMKDFSLVASSQKKNTLDSIRVDSCKKAEASPPIPVVETVVIPKAEYMKFKIAFEALASKIEAPKTT